MTRPAIIRRCAGAALAVLFAFGVAVDRAGAGDVSFAALETDDTVPGEGDLPRPGPGQADLLLGAEGPRRVVSMNLCTDQLALLLAAEGQVISVSHWAAQPDASNMAEEAAGITRNRAGAEEIFLMRPDLVLAGAFTNRIGVDMLRRLGITVEIFRAARSIDAIPEQLRRMGKLLGREKAAEQLVGRFERGLEHIAARTGRGPRPVAAYHYPNNYTSGDETLAADVLDRAGFDNAAAVLGLTGARRLALETLVMARPFLVRTWPISGTRTGRSYETATHPALKRLIAEQGGAVLAERWQICATPFVLDAIATLAAKRPDG